MKIYLHAQGFEMTAAIEEHAQKQLKRCLASLEEQVVAVEFHLSDINGPKGGVDKKALVCVRLATRLTVKLERTDSDLYYAISSVARQLRRTLKRNLRKQNRIERSLLREMRQFGDAAQAS